MMNQLHNLLHDSLISTNHVNQAAILRRKDYQVRASSVGFNLSDKEVHTLVDAFKSPSDIRERGLFWDSKDFNCLRADKDSIYAKYDNTGLILVRTATLLIVATYNEKMLPAICVEATEKLAEYFREKGK